MNSKRNSQTRRRKPRKKQKRYPAKLKFRQNQNYNHPALNALEYEDFEEIVDFDEDKMYQYVDQETVSKIRVKHRKGPANKKKHTPADIKFNL